MDSQEQAVSSVNLFVFAHNEQAHIEACLKSLMVAIKNLQINIKGYVLVNGCSDNTVNVAQSFLQTNPQPKAEWSVINIKMGDKSNAWNVALHDCLTDQSLSFFIDGDCTISETSIASIYNQYHKKPNYYAFSAYPATLGRDFSFITHNTFLGEGLSGNFYALSPVFISQIIETGFKLPVGLIGDDSLLSWICKTGLTPTNRVEQSQICPVQNATYCYKRLMPDSFTNLKSYLTRLKRYSIRHMQQECIREYLEPELNFMTLPEHISLIYPFLEKRFIRRDNLICYIFDIWAFNTIKTEIEDA